MSAATDRTQCKKCRSTHVRMMWMRARSFLEPGNRARPEHLKIVCLRCGYCWETPTADADPPLSHELEN